MVQQQQQNWWWSKNCCFFSILVGIFLTSNTVFTQNNIVENYSFEDYYECPYTTGNYNIKLKNWFNFSQNSTSDYLNTCAFNFTGGIPNYLGYQLPKSGNGYLRMQLSARNSQFGFLFWNGNNFIYGRENILGCFNNYLNKGSYYIEIKVNLARISNEIMATNAFDMLLLTDTIYRPYDGAPPHIDLQQVINLNPSGKIIYDTLNWVKLSTCFEATGGERFFAIGTFRDTLDIQYDAFDHPNEEFLSASYYFEDVRIFPCENCCSDGNAFPDFVVVSSNPGTATNPTVFNINLSVAASASLELYDSAGRRVANYTTQAAMSAFPAPSLASGVYHYRFTSSNEVLQTGKFVVE